MHLSAVIRSLIQLTIDITNVPSILDQDNQPRVQEYLLCLLHTMKSESLTPESIRSLLFESLSEIEWFATLCWNLAVFYSSVLNYDQASFFWYLNYCFLSLCSPSTDLYNMERQSLTLTVATYLQTEASHEESHTAQGDCDGLSVTKCLSLLTTCRGVLKELPPSAIVEETQVYLNQLEVTCLIRINDSTLLPKLKEYSSSHLFSFSFFLDMYYILEQENSKDTGAKKECLRTALQVLLQQPSFSLTSVCEVIHCLLLVCESKIEEYHWIEQLLQIVKTYGEPVLPTLLFYV